MNNLRINLGCGNYPLKNYINHDIIKHRPEIDVAFDLNKEYWDIIIHDNKGKFNYIFEDEKYSQIRMNSISEESGDNTINLSLRNVFDEIRAYDVLEHLDDPINFMDNCWLLLEKNGILDLKVCGWKNPNFYVDITHKKAYAINSFDYFDETTALGKEFSYYTPYKWKILDKHFDRKNNVLIKLTPKIMENNKYKKEILLEIKARMSNTKDKCRWCGEGEDNNHDEGIHLINTMIEETEK